MYGFSSFMYSFIQCRLIDYLMLCFSSIMEARWGGKVEITKKTNNADQVTSLNILKLFLIVFVSAHSPRIKRAGMLVKKFEINLGVAQVFFDPGRYPPCRCHEGRPPIAT